MFWENLSLSFKNVLILKLKYAKIIRVSSLLFFEENYYEKRLF